MSSSAAAITSQPETLIGRRASLAGRRVLQVGKFYPPYTGGMESHLHSLCGELRKAVDLRVLVANTSRRHQEEVVDGVPVVRAGMLFKLSSAPVCTRMSRIIRNTAADIIHIHLPNPVGMMSYLASRHPAKLILTWHSDVVKQRFLRNALRPLEFLTLRRAEALIATSPNYIESSNALTRHKERCRVIPFGIRVNDYSPSDARMVEALRQRYGSRIVLAVGRLVPYKGFDYLIRAMAQVKGHLIIVGDGLLDRQLERTALDAGVQSRVTFLHRTSSDDLVSHYHAADVFALPSVARSEAFGIVQLEAMACGVPVVNTRLASGVPFVSIDGMTGVTVPPRDPEALAAAINLLLNNPSLRRRYGDAARLRVKSEFSLDTMVDRTLGVYSEALGET